MNSRRSFWRKKSTNLASNLAKWREGILAHKVTAASYLRRWSNMVVEISQCGYPVKVSQDSTPQDHSTVDDVLSQAGEFGFVQNMVRVTVCVLLLTTACHTGLVFFTGHSPPWKCSSTATRLVLCALLTKCKSVLIYSFTQRFFFTHWFCQNVQSISHVFFKAE